MYPKGLRDSGRGANLIPDSHGWIALHRDPALLFEFAAQLEGESLRAAVHDRRTLLYRSQKAECDLCPLKLKCCPNTPHRKIPRDINEEARDVARALYDTSAFEQSSRDRKRVEMLFAHLKWILRLGRLRLREPIGQKLV